VTRPLKDPPPAIACGTCRVAIHTAGSPDEADQLARFDTAHPDGPRHERVAKLPDDHGDPSWNYDGGRR
jgi:hypothetical protein